MEAFFSQQPGDGPVIERIACGGGNFAVGGNFAFGDGTNDAAEGGIPLLVIAQRIFQNSSLEVLRRFRAAHAPRLPKAPAYFVSPARDKI